MFFQRRDKGGLRLRPTRGEGGSLVNSKVRFTARGQIDVHGLHGDIRRPFSLHYHFQHGHHPRRKRKILTPPFAERPNLIPWCVIWPRTITKGSGGFALVDNIYPGGFPFK